MIKKIILWILVFTWMTVIIDFSSDPVDVSREKSQVVIRIVDSKLTFFEKNFHIRLKLLKVKSKSYFIRKTAHIFNYFILTVLLFFALMETFRLNFMIYLYNILIPILFAMLDEYYQTFVPGRGGQISDVGIDSIGVLTGIILLRLFNLRRKTNTK